MLVHTTSERQNMYCDGEDRGCEWVSIGSCWLWVADGWSSDVFVSDVLIVSLMQVGPVEFGHCGAFNGCLVG